MSHQSLTHRGVAITTLIYLCGWGPLFTIGYLIGALMHIRWSGARAWRPALVWTVLGAGTAQLGIALGLVFTYLPPLPAQLAGLVGTFITVMLIRQ